ncbi:helix-turn-helix domain-containing protein [Jatrophihabitans lederbergiae]|uniref:Helix-turn-helix domain-containing protein n=1 Tax=Jatrophihabitans lederbergiae TaxID=3075547 RepID=A0ABU2J8Z6_9ACTN|nr:helix-turn-helix domain-containing protein [Jatrophihabitans sp. DSM 44399]MDT0261447.1 helix-turn-helix domain-containing protein [Jatrophihabitans sp. DSM 44399]
MAEALAQETAQTLRAALDEALRSATNVPTRAREALERLLVVLESHNDAVVFPADATLSTQEAAALLGVSRMTVVRLIDRGTLAAERGAVHRRIAVSELARYQRDSARRRRSAMAALADDLDENAPPDEVISTR